MLVCQCYSVSVRGSILECATACQSVLQSVSVTEGQSVLQSVRVLHVSARYSISVCYRVSVCAMVYQSVLQSIRVLQCECVTACQSVLQRVRVCTTAFQSLLQCVRVLQRVSVVCDSVICSYTAVRATVIEHQSTPPNLRIQQHCNVLVCFMYEPVQKFKFSFLNMCNKTNTDHVF